MGRKKEGALISDIRIKENFKPKTKNITPKVKGSPIPQAVRQLVKTQDTERADPSMQEVDRAVGQTAAVSKKGRAAFRRQVQNHRQAKAKQRQLADRFFPTIADSSREPVPVSQKRQPAEHGKPNIRSRQNVFNAPKQKPVVSLKTQNSLEAVLKTDRVNAIKTAENAAKASRFHFAAQSKKKAAVERGRRQFEKEAKKKMTAKQAAKRTAEAGKKMTAAVAKTVKTLISAFSAGGVAVVLLAVLILFAVIAAIAASPLGILFSDSGPGSVSLSAAVAQINAEYSAKLYEMQSGSYAEIVLEGKPPDWVDVVAVFACSVTGDGENPMDVATLDDTRVQLLKNTFWEMCQITMAERKTEQTGESKTTLVIRISGKTAEQMRTEKQFTVYQNTALDTLLENRTSLRQLLGDLTTTDEKALQLWKALPDSLPEQRRQVLRHALSLVGKVNYFWGGKSLALGWDERWGQLQKVWADGSKTTGTYRPYGLDCSGFVDWVFYNASGGSYVIGHGGGAASQHSYCRNIPWNAAQPGDLVFYPDDSHIGIVGGRDADGALLIIHCTSGVNGVTVSGSAGFSVVARPDYYR